MRLFRRKKSQNRRNSDGAITAKEAHVLARASSTTGYNIYDSITEKATAGRLNLYVNKVKLSPRDIDELRIQGFKVREVKQGSTVTYFSIEW